MESVEVRGCPVPWHMPHAFLLCPGRPFASPRQTTSGTARWMWVQGHPDGRMKGGQELSWVRMIGSPSSFLLLVAMPGAPSSVLAPSSKARSP